MTAMVATAHCIGRCDWSAGPGAMDAIDKLAEKHTKTTKHPTVTIGEANR